MKTKITLTNQERLDILTNAIESNGIQYWACDYGRITIARDQEHNITKAKFDANNEKGEKTHYTVSGTTIQNGVNKILDTGFEVSPYIVIQILSGDTDAITDDCIIQVALFGQLVYG